MQSHGGNQPIQSFLLPPLHSRLYTDKIAIPLSFETKTSGSSMRNLAIT
jgi:hypothetical protein